MEDVAEFLAKRDSSGDLRAAEGLRGDDREATVSRGRRTAVGGVNPPRKMGPSQIFKLFSDESLNRPPRSVRLLSPGEGWSLPVDARFGFVSGRAAAEKQCCTCIRCCVANNPPSFPAKPISYAHVSQSSLRLHPYGRQHIIRNGYGPLKLQCVTFPFTTPRRFIPAHGGLNTET